MKCIFCKIVETSKATLILDKGAQWRVRYCPACECVQRIGDSVPGAEGSYRGSFARMHDYDKKGGDEH